jgi:hypothetical protein
MYSLLIVIRTVPASSPYYGPFTSSASTQQARLSPQVDMGRGQTLASGRGKVPRVSGTILTELAMPATPGWGEDRLVLVMAGGRVGFRGEVKSGFSGLTEEECR